MLSCTVGLWHCRFWVFLEAHNTSVFEDCSPLLFPPCLVLHREFGLKLPTPPPRPLRHKPSPYMVHVKQDDPSCFPREAKGSFRPIQHLHVLQSQQLVRSLNLLIGKRGLGFRLLHLKFMPLKWSFEEAHVYLLTHKHLPPPPYTPTHMCLWSWGWNNLRPWTLREGECFT